MTWQALSGWSPSCFSSCHCVWPRQGVASGRWSEGWARSRAWEPAGSEGSPHHAGRSIGLCNGKLKAMSGEEVDGMEQEELADCVGKVRSSRGGLVGGAGGRVSAPSSRNLLFCASVSRCLSSSGPAQSTSSKSLRFAVCLICLVGPVQDGGGALLRGVSPGPKLGAWAVLRLGGGGQGDLCPAHQNRSGTWVVQRER